MLEILIKKVKVRRWERFVEKRTAAILQTGFWFVDIPRTGSTSLKVQFESLSLNGYGKSGNNAGHAARKPFFKDHTTAQQVCDSIGMNNWKSLYTFSIVRNPWCRFFSIYNYRLKMGLIPEKVSFEDYVGLLKKFDVWSNKSPYVSAEYWWPMSGFFLDRKSEVLVNKIYRFEDYDFMINDLRDKLGIALRNSSSLNRTDPEYSYREAYTPESREIIGQFYAADIDRFEYSFSK